MLTQGVCASSPLQLQMTRDTFSCSVVGCGGWSSGGLKWIWQQCVYGVGKRAVEPHDLNMKGVITVCVCVLLALHFKLRPGPCCTRYDGVALRELHLYLTGSDFTSLNCWVHT